MTGTDTGTITVGVDGSPESLVAADWAVHEARRRSMKLRLIHVREHPHGPVLPPVDDEERRKQGDELLRGTAETLRGIDPQADIHREQIIGRPSRVLAEAGQESGLLVLGSRGLSGLAGFFVGSVALATVGHSSSPTVLVRAGTPGDRGSEVVLGVDLDRAYEDVLAFAFTEAQLRKSPLRVVHDFRPPLALGINRVTLDPNLMNTVTESAERGLRDMLGPWRERYPDVEVREQAVCGWPAHSLVETSRNASLVVVGRRIRSAPFTTHIGAVTHAVMHHCRVPVAVVPYR